MDGGGWEHETVTIKLEQCGQLWQWRGSDGWTYSPIFDSQQEALDYCKSGIALRRYDYTA